jgi:hypothetical protein
MNGYGLDVWGLKYVRSIENFSLHHYFWNDLGPTHMWVPRALSTGVKWPECEADYSPDLVLRSRMCGAVSPCLLYSFVAWHLGTGIFVHFSLNLRGNVQHEVLRNVCRDFNKT